MNLKEAKKKVLEGLELQEVNSGVYFGEWMPVEGKDVVESICPADGHVLGSVAQGTTEDYEKVMIAAEEASKVWSRIPAPRRGEIIREIGSELFKNKELQIGRAHV